MFQTATLILAAGGAALFWSAAPWIIRSLSAWIVAFYLWWRIRSREPVWFGWPGFAGAAVSAAAVLLLAIPWSAFLPWAPVHVAAGAATAVIRPTLRGATKLRT